MKITRKYFVASFARVLMRLGNPYLCTVDLEAMYATTTKARKSFGKAVTSHVNRLGEIRKFDFLTVAE